MVAVNFTAANSRVMLRPEDRPWPCQVFYTAPYTAGSYGIGNDAATGFSIYRRTLQPGDSFSAVFKMPRVPVADANQRAAIVDADYDVNRAAAVAYWRGMLDKCGLVIPEKRVQESWRAGLVHVLLATRNANGVKRVGDGIPYDALFLSSAAEHLQALDYFGIGDSVVMCNLPLILSQQQSDGLFVDNALTGPYGPILASHGQIMYTLALHYLLTGDKSYASAAYPAIKKGALFIINDHKANANGLMRPSIPYDNEMIKGCYTSHNLWAVLALRMAIRMARGLGNTADVATFQAGYDTYLAAVKRAIDTTCAKRGFVTTGLYDYIVGPAARAGFELWSTDQDWENNLLVLPTEVLDAADPRVKKTVDTIRYRKYREGIMTYRNGMHLHQYITNNQAEQYLAIGEDRQALIDFYHVLAHNGSCHEGFENLTEPWTDRTTDPGCPPPHTWAASKQALFIRNMMLREYGGDAGMRENERGLVLFSLISPNWNVAGKQIVINNMPCEMGKISATLTFTGSGADIAITPNFTWKPAFIAVHVPYFVDLQSASATGDTSYVNGRMVYCGPGVTHLTLSWTPNDADADSYQRILRGYRSEFGFMADPAGYTAANAGTPYLFPEEKNAAYEPLSFNLVKKAFLREYTLRFQEYVKNGGTPWVIAAPNN